MSRSMKKMGKITKRLVLPLFLLLTCSSCAYLLDESQKNPRSWQEAMKTAPIRDEVAKNYVQQLGKKLAALEPDQSWRIQSVSVRIPSTSRIQGNSEYDIGEINISRGMLNILSNEAELACLIGHEIGHKVLHDKNRQYDREKSDWKDIFLSDEAAESRWSKGREQEADEYGAKLCRKAGYNPYAFLGFFERLATFQEGSLLREIREWTSTHKDFRNRAKNLRQFLEKENMAETGALNEKVYRQNLAGLKHIQTTDAVNEVMPGGSQHTLKQLLEIKSELKTHLQNKTPLTAERYLEIMRDLEKVLKRHRISRSHLKIAADDYFLIPYSLSFMKEVLSQNEPVWTDDEAIQKEILEILSLLGRVGVGFVPVVGDAVDFYEFLTGREFGTGVELTLVERNFTAIGLLAGSGKMWREAAGGIARTLDDTTLARRVGKGSVKEARRVVKQAEKIVEAAQDSKVVVIGESMEKRVIAHAKKINAKWYKARKIKPFDETLAIKRNERWIKEKIKDGYTFVDIGIDFDKATRSEFYKLEKEILNRSSARVIEMQMK